MPEAIKRNRLMPWIIGLVINVGAAATAGWMLLSNGCAVPAPTLLIALAVMPAIYIVLMYLTLTSQE
jgi:hypothetical protein